MNVVPRNRILPVSLSLLVVAALTGCVHRSYPPPRPAVIAPIGPDRWEAGMAKTDITPPLGYRMAGYFYERFATGEHDPLKAKALVLRQGQQEVALVFCDLLGPSLEVSRKARLEASRATGIPVTNIVVAATHSHTGPLFDDVRGDRFHREAIARYGYDPHEPIDYPAFLTRQIVQAIIEARSNVAPATLKVGITNQQGLPFNRRYLMRNGKVVFNPGLLNTNIVRPAGPVDSQVSFILVKHDKTPEPIGGLTVFAMHADTVGGTEYSADYPYFIQQSLRKAFGPGFISAFGAGTCGDINNVDVTKKGPVSGFPISESLGGRIAATVLADLPRLKAIDKPELAVRSTTLEMPLQTITPRQLAEAKVILDHDRDRNMNFYLKVEAVKDADLVQRGKTWPMEVQVFRLNKETAIVCLPAEIFVELGLAIKAASPFKQTLVISVCNDRPGYVPTLKAFGEGSYEVINSRVHPGGGEQMVQAAIQMLNDLKHNS